MERSLEKKKVTKNQYNEIMRLEADNAWKKILALNLEGEALKEAKRQIWVEYDETLDSYEVLPFEINIANDTLKEVINSYCNEEVVRENKTLYKGYYPNSSILYDVQRLFGGTIIFEDYYQSCLCNEELRFFFSYTEGDICFSIPNTEKDYLEEKATAEKFYKEL